LTLKADRYGGIVVGTRNRSEVVIVYTVKHGD
jgi:NH3-dependent NAD+ synthetase